MKIAYLDCFSGISGDMLLGALIDAGFSPQRLTEMVADLGLPENVEVQVGNVVKNGLRACSVAIKTGESHHHRHLQDINIIIENSHLPDAVQQNALTVFRRLAEAEARVHGTNVENVHFHEVGALDSIVDILGSMLGLHELGIAQVYASPLPFSGGSVTGAHGKLPLPAPATAELLAAARAPLVPCDAAVELVTPTGAAILAALACFERPALRLHRVGVGAGQRDLEWANILRVLIGEAEDAARPEVVTLECNIDDMNPEYFGAVMDALFEAGALDVYFSPIYMKKNRPAAMLSVIARPADETALAQMLLKETTTFGLRVQRATRYEAQRETRTVATPFGEIRVKLKMLAGEICQAAPEYEDCRKAALAQGVPPYTVYTAAAAAAAQLIKSG